MIVKASDWQRPTIADSAQITETVNQMLLDIKQRGMTAVNEYSNTFDGFAAEVIALQAFDEYPLDDALKTSIQTAAQRIEQFARFQKQQLTSAEFTDAMGTFAQVINPIEQVGCYIPGGRFPLISTALMTLIPAKVAGSKVRIACSPSDHPAILAAASLAGATKFIKLGGVQAIAMLAYQEQVDLIVGPGNAYVNEAKKLLQGQVKIDGLAGPSELMALCDDKQPVSWLAYDALAQAEHDPNAISIIVSDKEQWLEAMAEFLVSDDTFARLITNQQIQLVLADSVEQIIELSESYAAEHLMLCHEAIHQAQLTQYGSLFIGANSAVALGDYISGPNHTLPTHANARQTGGLNVLSFLKVQTVQKITDDGRIALAQAAMPLAAAEGLVQHFNSLKIRL